MGTPCELTRAFRNENLWIGTCFQESPDSCIQESKRPVSPVFMRVLRTVTRAREFNFLNSLTARRWLRDRGALLAAMLTLGGRGVQSLRHDASNACVVDARRGVPQRWRFLLALFFLCWRCSPFVPPCRCGLACKQGGTKPEHEPRPVEQRIRPGQDM
jgi:hypothetical protein